MTLRYIDGARRRFSPIWRTLPFLLASAAFAQPAPATAQIQIHASPPPAALATIAVSEDDPKETTLLLTFAQGVPQYSIIKNDSDHLSISLSLSTLTSGATLPKGLHGPLRSVSFDRRDNALVVNFSAAGPVHMTVTPARNSGLSIQFDPLTSPDQAQTTLPTNSALPEAVDPPAGRDGFEIVPLKYADVSEIVGLLTDGLSVKSNDSFTPQEPAFGSASMNGSAAAVSYAPNPGAPNPDTNDESVGQSVDDTIGVDRRLNAIILRGSPERIARLKAEIAQIDVPVQSVILETVFVELDESGAKNVGLDFNNANSQIAVATLQTGAFNIFGGATERPLTSIALQGAIYAQVSAGHGRIVSKPQIAAQSGATAKIITGDALPILTAITLSGVNAVSQQVQYVNVGVTLQIAPRVSNDGFVTSHIFCVVSSVTGTSQGYPTISQREAETSATVRDGETFVIGGLTEESDIHSTNRVPGLADLPLAGALFKLHTGTHSKTELYIVVTPHIVRGSDAARLAHIDAAQTVSVDRY